MILSDVGLAASNSDGQLFVIDEASFASGLTPVRTQIGGTASKLGNPVDIAFDGVHLFVAEKINNLILRFDFITDSDGGDIAADDSVIRTAPESVQLVPSWVGLGSED